MSEPLISIIVPVYNVEKWLKRCIDSIVNQTYHHLQILLINDGSTDQSEVICLSYQDARIEYISIEHQGASAARNEGLRRAKGAYIGFVDADDWCESNMFETLLNTIQNDHSDAVRCNYRIVQDLSDKLSIKQPIKQIVTGRDAIIDTLYHTDTSGFGGIVWNTLFRAEIVKNNAILFDLDLFYGEDTDWICQFFIRSNRISFIPDCLYNHNKENVSSITHGFRNYYPIKIMRKNRAFLIEHGFDPQHVAHVEDSLRLTQIMIEVDEYCQGGTQTTETIDHCSIVRDVLMKNKMCLGMIKISLVMLMIRMRLPNWLVRSIMSLHR